jgi:hypothetical protein
MFASLHQLILISCSIWWRRRSLRVHRPVLHRIHLPQVRIWNVVVASTSHLVRYSAAQEVPICLPPLGVRYCGYLFVWAVAANGSGPGSRPVPASARRARKWGQPMACILASSDGRSRCSS